MKNAKGIVLRAEYTIGVRGCGRQSIYVTICIDNENCNALADSGRIEEALDNE